MSFRILTFCGGGIRGLLSAGILNRLAEKYPDIVAKADLLAGTSTGADIISMLLAKKTPAEIYANYVNQAPKFFKRQGRNPRRPAYHVADLVLAQRVMHPLNPPLSKLKQKVLFTAFNVGSAKRRWEPRLFHNLAGSTTAGTRIVDAVVSSSAMCGMFGSHQGNVDGAFVHHDPTLAAIAVAVRAGAKLDEIVVLDFGTGFMANWIASDTAKWGAHQWQHGDGNRQSRLPPLLINGKPSPILNISLNGTSTNLIPHLAGLMLPQRFAYLNPTLDRIVPENDTKPADLKYLERKAATADLTEAERLLKKYWR